MSAVLAGKNIILNGVEVTQDLVRRCGCVLGVLPAPGQASAPELVVEDDELDVEVLGVGDQSGREYPSLPQVHLGSRLEEHVDGAAVFVDRLRGVPGADTAGAGGFSGSRGGVVQEIPSPRNGTV